MTLPRIALISLGGTIESLGADRLDHAHYPRLDERLPRGELLRAVPELGEIAQVIPVPWRRVSSSAITSTDWIALNSRILALAEEGFDGVVLTHGTNTLEETAFFLHLTLTTAMPVVVVGAMRPANSLGADGYINLLQAVRVAANQSSRSHGVLVVMNDTIISARDATKTATFRIDAFTGRDVGPMGYADADGSVLYYHRQFRTPPRISIAPELDRLPRVDIVTSHVDADGRLIDASRAAGAKGLVAAATGAGRTTPAEAEALERACEAGVVVCMSSRVPGGRVPVSTSSDQFVWSDNLPAWKARVALAVALTRHDTHETIREWFEQI